VPAPARREQLLAAAAALFAERGFHAVGIDDVGAAAGITGPGVYRHFPSKAALLTALCDRALSRMLDGARSISAASGDPLARLEALVDLHVAFAVDERALISVWVRELSSLPEDVRRALRRRMREYEQPWQEVLGCLREDLSPTGVAVVTAGTLAMLNATPAVPAHVSRDEVVALLRTMALGALLSRPAPVPGGAVR
jgi:AcrR family transcriptional regulator